MPSHNQGSVEILEDDCPASPGNANSLNEFLEVVADQDDVSAFASDIGPASHRYTHGGLGQRRCIIDAIAQHGDHSPTLCMCSDLNRFLLRSISVSYTYKPHIKRI